MSKRDDRVSMRDMLDHAQEAVNFLAGSSRKDLAWKTVNSDLPPLIEALRRILKKA